MHQCGEAADKVDADFAGGFVHMASDFDHIILAQSVGDQGHGGNGNSFIDNRYAVFFFNIIAHFYQLGGVAENFVIDLLSALLAAGGMAA